MSNKNLLHQGLSEPAFYNGLVYKFKQIIGRSDFFDKFRKIIIRNQSIGYDLNFMRQSEFLVINAITVDNFAALFNRAPVDRTPDSMMADLKLFILVLWDHSSSSVAWSTWAQLMIFYLRFPVLLFICHNTLYLLSPRLCFFIVLKRDLCVYHDDLRVRGLSCEQTNQQNILYHFKD